MTAEALTRRPNRLAIRSRLHVAPVSVQSVGALLPDTGLVLLELLLAHHLATVVVSHDLFILNVSLDVTGGITAHMDSLSHFLLTIFKY